MVVSNVGDLILSSNFAEPNRVSILDSAPKGHYMGALVYQHLDMSTTIFRERNREITST